MSRSRGGRGEGPARRRTRWPRRLRPRSLRGRLVLIAGLLATGIVLLCQVAALTVLHTWLTDQVDHRLSHFRPPDQVFEDMAHGTMLRRPPPRPDDVLPSDYRVFFYDGAGHLLRDSLGSGNGPGPRLPDSADGLGMADGRPGTLPSEGEGAGWRAVTQPGPGGTRVVVALPLNTVDGATTKMLWFSLGLGLAVAVGVVVLGNGAVRLGLRPLTRVEHTAQHITEGALELNVPVTDPDTEVGRLGLALNTMLDRLRTALRRTETSEARLRHFMADAGHELRTPLTAIQGFAELLLAGPDLTGRELHEAHVLIARNAERMSRLVDDLFLLAKLDDAPVVHREPVDLLSLTADAIATTAVRHPRRAISLEPLEALTTGPEPGLDVVEAPGDPHQLAQVLGNLLDNACVHTPPDSRVRVRVGAARAAEDRTPGHGRVLPPGLPVCVIEVADDGPGIVPDEAPHVFERFYRATPAGRTHRPARGADAGPAPAHLPEAGDSPGSGLGLAIAAAIASAHGGRLELDNRPGKGCVFRLLLPDASAVLHDVAHGSSPA
ncbi:HAMP domain-containing sensor histidine kinase [Streptomyces sp. NPDC052077]|uniref:HAMP domain-containing sensor histidine kinase n=1 Tax=Streptomyces sp. NPDC052077 TaxID=3154757 RepID=UPI00341F9FF2